MKCPYCIKKCTKCKKLLVANKNNFRKQKNGKYGLLSQCKNCEKEYQKVRIDELKEYRKQRYENNKEEILEKCKQYRENNKEKISKHKKQWYEDNKEDFLKNCKNYRENHKEEISMCKKQWYESNKENVLEKCKQYREENPEKMFNNNVKRRLREENQGDGISKEQWLEMMLWFDFRCAYSGEYIGNDSKHRTVDHIIPLSNGGEHEIWNCVPMYDSYNFSKHNKNMLEWYILQPFYSEERLNKIYEWMEYAEEKYKK